MPWLAGAGASAWQGYWTLAVCGLVNAAFLAYAIRSFVGWKECREDIARGLEAPQALPASNAEYAKLA